MLKFFMGKNTPERQQYIIRNLRFEHDVVEGEEAADGESEVAEVNEKAASEAA